MSAQLEEVLLGAVLDAEGPVLQSAASLLVEMSGMRAEDFSNPRCRVAWQVILRLTQRRKLGIDALSVFSSGRSVKAFNDADREWLQSLQHSNQLDRDRFANLVEDIRTQARHRQLESVLEQQLNILRGPDVNLTNVASEIDTAVKDIITASLPDGTGEEDVMELSNDWDAQESGTQAPTLFPTGLPMLDDLLGGWVPNLNILMALPSVGKSATLASCIDGQTAAGLKVGLFGLEEGTKWLSKRIIAREMSMPVRSVGFVKRTPEQHEQFSDVGARVAAQMRNLITYRRPRGALVDVREMLRRAASWVRNKDVQCIWVDHGGEIDPGIGQGQNDQMAYRVAANYARIRDFAEDYGVPVIVLCHTRRPEDGNEERPPLMTEAADSSRIEKMARVMVGGWRRRYVEPDYMRLTCLKANEGEPDVTVRVKRWTTAALLHRDQWERVDLQKEKAMEAKAKRDEKEAERLAAREAAKQKAAAEKNAKARQASLLREEA